jgi:signal peptidase II
MVLILKMDPDNVDFRLKAYGAAALVLALDRLSKWVIETNVSFLDTRRVIPGFFDIVRSENRGVAFGFFNDSTSEWRTLVLVLLSVAAVIGVSVLLWRPERRRPHPVWARDRFFIVLHW